MSGIDGLIMFLDDYGPLIMIITTENALETDCTDCAISSPGRCI